MAHGGISAATSYQQADEQGDWCRMIVGSLEVKEYCTEDDTKSPAQR